MLQDVYRLTRNDVDGAVAAYRHAALTATTRDQVSDVGEMVMMLQDEPEEIERRLAAVSREPAVAAALLKLGPITPAT